MDQNQIENYLEIKKISLTDLNRLYKELFCGGKGVRARLIQDISPYLNLSADEISLLCGSAEAIHHSSILHDDVIDSSKMRRNRSSTWVQFSKNKAILAGDYLLAHVSLKLSEYSNTELLKLTSQTIKKMVEGEWLQSEIIGKETKKNIDQVHLLKTASLFEWCVQAPFLCKQCFDPSLQALLSEIGQILGQLFQRADDALDFGVRNKENKDEFKDLNEGYLNFFGVHLMENISSVDRTILKACKSSDELKLKTGEKQWNRQIQLFDDMNQKLITSCLRKIQQLSSLLSSRQKETMVVLESWVNKLYFRQ